ncbi:CASTOR/POLLUX-related putative ion channel [Streptomyces roseolilacinus]|uniref:CASTOR/POLLUX-related putative ion channel n=1 Tax=Streptomyces roseolilacinus TaxID=66904 RepID=UPI00381CCFA0
MAQHTPHLWSRLRYRFDTLMAHGTPVLIGWLTAVCLAIVVPASVVLVGASRDVPTTAAGWGAAVWRSVGQTLRLGGEVGSPVYVMMSVLLALVALLFVSALVSLITTGLHHRLLALRSGRSPVLEERHTVLLGWTDQVFPVITELVAANADRRRAAVAVFADRDKVGMETEITSRVGGTGATRVVCRSGSTTDPTLLSVVSPHTAKAVLVLPPEDPGGDAHVVKTLLALRATGPGTRDCVVVAAVRDARNHPAAALAAGPHGHVLSVDDVVARLLVQTSRQPGLSLVHQELLDFAGDEFYVVPVPALTGRTFGEALGAFATSSVVGLRRDDGGMVLNPPPGTRIGPADRLVVITEDDGTAVLADTPPAVDEDAIVTARPRTPAAERLLLLGWNRRAPLIVEQLASYVPSGSTLDVVTLADAAAVRGARRADRAPGRLDVRLLSGDTTDRGRLAELDVPSYDRVLVIGDQGHAAGPDAEPERAADDRTLVTLLHLRDIEQSAGRELFVITEMTDDRNRLLAPVREGADFIVSDRLVSLLMTQISENPHLAALYDELFAAEGSEVHLKPAVDYVVTDRPVTFATVVESARRRHECAIGYRLHAGAATGPAHGIRINPDKREPVRFGDRDAVIVIAED